MTDLFLADESSVEDSQPRELVKIQQSKNVVYYLATGQRDIAWDGKTWVASPATRTNIGISTPGQDVMPTLTLALSHPFCQRYVKQGTPPQVCAVTIYRKQLRSGGVEQVFFGYATAMAFDSDGATVNAGGSQGGGAGHVGKFTLSQQLSRAMRRTLPCVPVSASVCPHVLYDKQCTIDPSGFSTTATVIGISGNSITINAAFADATYLVGGDIQHVASGEMMTIGDQINNGTSTTLTLLMPLPDANLGDSVIVRAGCDHGVATCLAKFSNNANFGGFPGKQAASPFVNGAVSIAVINTTAANLGSTIITPTASGTLNGWNPAGFNPSTAGAGTYASTIKVTLSGDATLTGLGMILIGAVVSIVHMSDAHTFTIANNSPLSTGGYRIFTLTGADMALPAGGSIVLMYSDALSGWVMTSFTA